MIDILSAMRKAFPWWIRHFNRLTITGIENLPRNTSGILAANHSGGWDMDNYTMMSLLDNFKTDRKDRKRVWLCYWDRWAEQAGVFSKWVQKFSPIPINLGGKGLPYPLIDNIVNRNELIAIMPEGHSASIHEKYRLWKFYPGVIRLHLQYQIPIIPMAFKGFVHVSPILAVSYNPKIVPPWEKEVMLPPIIPKKVKIIIGEPLEFSEYFGKHVSKQTLYLIASKVRTSIKRLLQ